VTRPVGLNRGLTPPWTLAEVGRAPQRCGFVRDFGRHAAREFSLPFMAGREHPAARAHAGRVLDVAGLDRDRKERND
jgi:hypothetical protein